jgi:hypothetical protein
LYFSNKIKLKKPFLYKYFDKKRVRKERLSIDNTKIHASVQKLFLPKELNELLELAYLHIYAPHLPLEFAENLCQWHHLQELILRVEILQNFLPAEALTQVHTLKIEKSYQIKKASFLSLDKILY